MAVERLSIPVSSTVADALRTLAWREDRDPRRQAERLIREGLIAAGALPASDLNADPKPIKAAS